MFSLKQWIFLWIVCGSWVALGQQMPEGRLMRFPDIYKNKIAFMYGGDLWLASKQWRRGSPDHFPSRARAISEISPDGKWIRIHRPVRRQFQCLRHALRMADSPSNSRSTRAAATPLTTAWES